MRPRVRAPALACANRERELRDYGLVARHLEVLLQHDLPLKTNLSVTGGRDREKADRRRSRKHA